jgi:hypothetical protein
MFAAAEANLEPDFLDSSAEQLAKMLGRRL